MNPAIYPAQDLDWIINNFIERVPDAQGLNGNDAINLWWDYLRGNDDALGPLLAYNAADVVNMELLLEYAYPRLCAAAESV